ncbi:AAA family ATPase [Bacillus sp. EAC]|uniref:AAA family ATPase n=1 Tax=Bacillus sp. EAC TaxID=1978338 RepID=UPI000B43EB4B|nr:AAA family ATPase [Bacillus sp. EAC]
MFFLQMAGFPGSGKSTLSRLIAKNTGAIVIDHDIVKSPLLESLGPTVDSKEVGKISYDIEWSLIDFHLSLGNNVILDSPCFYTELVEKGTLLTKKHNAKYKFVECYLNNFDEINYRLKKRERMISQIHEAKNEEAFLEWVNNTKRPTHDYLIVETANPIESYFNEVMKYLNN